MKLVLSARSPFTQFAGQHPPADLSPKFHVFVRPILAPCGQEIPSLEQNNNAGIFTGANVLEDTEEQFRLDIETNVFGTLGVTKALLPALRKNNTAAIANVASIAALAAMPSFGGYSASSGFALNLLSANGQAPARPLRAGLLLLAR